MFQPRCIFTMEFQSSGIKKHSKSSGVTPEFDFARIGMDRIFNHKPSLVLEN